jgi:ATP-dependent protease ClpP protease subunit
MTFQSQQVAPVVYATFSDDMNQDSLNRVLCNFAKASQFGVRTIHLLFQSPGGIVSDAVALYSYFIRLPFDLHIYNPSAVSSAAVVAFVGAKHRYASAHAGFLIHTARHNFPTATDATGHRAIADSLLFDDNRAQSIITSRTQIPASKWAANDVIMPAQEALQLGLIGAIGDFQPPNGSKLFHI